MRLCEEYKMSQGRKTRQRSEDRHVAATVVTVVGMLKKGGGIDSF